MKHLCFILIGYTLLVVHSNGFLLQQKSSARKANSVSHSKLYEVKHKLQKKVGNLRTKTENDMTLFTSQTEKDFKLLVSQLQRELTALNTKLEVIEQRNDLASLDCDLKYKQLNDKYSKLVSEFDLMKENVVKHLEKETSRRKESVFSLQSGFHTTTTLLKNDFDRQFVLLWSRVNASTKEMVKLNQRYNALIEAVAVTVCTVGFYSYPSKLPFTDIKSQTGPIDTDALKNGDFICPSSGLYMVSFTLVSSTSKADFFIYKNDTQVIYHLVSNDDNYDSGTTVVALDLHVNDTVSVKPGSGSGVYFYPYGSCMTVIKIT